jgi:hypothetical protein
MKSSAQYLVKHANLEAVRLAFGSAEPVPSSGWLRCDLRLGASPPNDDVLWGKASLTVPRSQEFGEVVYLFGDSSTDSFVYEHARDGQMLRKPVWFPMLDDDWTAGWLCAQGEPEPWEAALFASDGLERFLEREQQRHDDEGRSDAFEAHSAQVRAVWAAGRIEAGRTYPECDASVVALVERYYGAQR